MIGDIGLEIRPRMTLTVWAANGASEEWTVGRHAAERESILVEGSGTRSLPESSDLYIPVPEEFTDTEAVLLPLAVQVMEAVRRSEASLGDRLLIFGDCLRGRLAVYSAKRRGIVPVVASNEEADTTSHGRQPSAALVVEGGRGFEAAACQKVRGGGLVVLATAPQGKPGEFDFYRNLQRTGVRLIGVPPQLPKLSQRERVEAAHILRAFLADGGGPPIVAAAQQGPGILKEYLVRWDA